VHSYPPEEFKRRIVNIDRKQTGGIRIYDLLQTYREGSNLRKTSEHEISIADLLALPEKKCNQRIASFYRQLKTVLPPPERLILPYSSNKEERKNALVPRANRLYSNLDLSSAILPTFK
jgi:hypothetical protein